MTSKEVTLDIIALKKRGLSERRIARQLGMDRRTVKKYAERPERALQPRRSANRKSKLDTFTEIVKAWIEQDPLYSSVWVYDRLKPMGYTGGYDIVKNFVRGLKAKRTQVAYLRFETEPGLQAQADWAEFAWLLPDGSSRIFYLFAMILGFSRKLYCELVEKCDLTTFLDCHIRAFEYFGGVPGEILYDRMRNVFIRKLAGKTEFNRSLTSMALHYGFKPMVAPAYAPWVKGKVERPIDFVREGFWRGYGVTSRERANLDLLAWLEMKSQRIHGTTHEPICDRFEREKPALWSIPKDAFDTSYQAFRPVHKDCTVHFEANRYMVPHTLVGKNLVLRVKNRVVRMYDDSTHIVTYCIPEQKGQFVFEQRFIDALKNDREMNRIKYGRGIRCRKGRAVTISPSIPVWAIDVEIRSMNTYDLVHEPSAGLREEVAA
jgi:transposase